MADLNQAKLLSGSSLENGRAIVLTANYQTLHVAVNSTTEWDVVTIFIGSNGNHQATISWGGVEFIVAVTTHQIALAMDRWRINSGLEIQIKTSSPNNMNAYVMVDRYPAG